MAKASTVKRQQASDEFDFSNMVQSSADDDAMMGMMSGLVEASQHQIQMALELTKIIVDKNTASSMTEKEILSAFQRSSQAVSRQSPLKEFWERMGV